MLLEQLSDGDNFTSNEKDIARFILNNIDDVGGMTSEQLANLSYTSKATVVRLCKKLGLKGYKEFKVKLIVEINQNKRINQMLANEPITNESTCQDIIGTLPILYDKAITHTRLSLNKDSLNRLSSVLKNSDKIEIYGTGISYMLAQTAAFKFATLGVECSAYESINAHALAAQKQKRTLTLLISFTGANRTVARIAEYLSKTTDNYVIGILGPYSGEIEQWCDEIIEIPNRDSSLSLDIITSFTAANYIMDIIFSLVLSSNYAEHLQTSIKTLKYESLLLNEKE